MSLPGWDSIESVGAIAKFFHIAGLVAIVLLALFEVIAYVYDHHKDALSQLQRRQNPMRAPRPSEQGKEVHERVGQETSVTICCNAHHRAMDTL
jgi:hypothetical protein